MYKKTPYPIHGSLSSDDENDDKDKMTNLIICHDAGSLHTS
jgi:hypothetical protein